MASVTITLQPIEDSLLNQRLQLLKQHKLGTSFTIFDQQPISNHLIHTARICQAIDTDLYFYELPLQNHYKPISPYNEMRTLLHLKRLFASLIDAEKNAASIQVLKFAYNSIVSLYSAFCSARWKAEPKFAPVKEKKQHANDAIFQTFISWVNTATEIKRVGIEVEEFEGLGKGIIAIQDIYRDQAVLTIPRKCILCAKTALENAEIGPKIASLANKCDLDKDTILTLFVLFERFGNPKSFWKPYFDFIDTTCFQTNSPLFYSDEELSILQGTPIYMEIMQAKEQLKEFCDAYFPVFQEELKDCFPKHVLTFENMLWFRALVESRAITFPEPLGCSLVPYMDCLNSSAYPQLEGRGHYVEQSDSIVLKSVMDCIRGEQLYICYGPYSNRELFQYYGYVAENNPYDKFYFELSYPEDGNEDIKREILEKYNLSVEHYFIKGNIPSKLMAAMRILLLSEEDVDLDAILEDETNKFNPYEQVSKTNEEGLLQTLIATLESLLGNLQEEEDDDAALVLKTQTANGKLALRYKQVVVEILQSSLDTLSDKLKALQLEDAE